MSGVFAYIALARLGIDPAQEKKRQARAEKAKKAHTFESVAY